MYGPNTGRRKGKFENEESQNKFMHHCFEASNVPGDGMCGYRAVMAVLCRKSIALHSSVGKRVLKIIGKVPPEHKGDEELWKAHRLMSLLVTKQSSTAGKGGEDTDDRAKITFAKLKETIKNGNGVADDSLWMSNHDLLALSRMFRLNVHIVEKGQGRHNPMYIRNPHVRSGRHTTIHLTLDVDKKHYFPMFLRKADCLTDAPVGGFTTDFDSNGKASRDTIDMTADTDKTICGTKAGSLAEGCAFTTSYPAFMKDVKDSPKMPSSSMSSIVLLQCNPSLLMPALGKITSTSKASIPMMWHLDFNNFFAAREDNFKSAVTSSVKMLTARTGPATYFKRFGTNEPDKLRRYMEIDHTTVSWSDILKQLENCISTDLLGGAKPLFKWALIHTECPCKAFGVERLGTRGDEIHPHDGVQSFHYDYSVSSRRNCLSMIINLDKLVAETWFDVGCWAPSAKVKYREREGIMFGHWRHAGGMFTEACKTYDGKNCDRRLLKLHAEIVGGRAHLSQEGKVEYLTVYNV
jgi:hypothetical protein